MAKYFVPSKAIDDVFAEIDRAAPEGAEGQWFPQSWLLTVLGNGKWWRIETDGEHADLEEEIVLPASRTPPESETYEESSWSYGAYG